MLAFPCTALTIGRAWGGHVTVVAEELFDEGFAEEFGHDLKLLHEVFVEGFTAFDTVHKEKPGAAA